MGNGAEELLLRIAGDSSGGQEAVQRLADALSNSLASALRSASAESKTSGEHVSALQKYLDELTPSTTNAHAAFTDLQGTLKEMWEDPKRGVSDLAKAISVDLGPALGAIGVAGGVAVGVLVTVASVAFEVTEKV